MRHSKDGKQTIKKYMGLELSGEIKTEDKNCESSENTDNMKPWGGGKITREKNQNRTSSI